jgi:hypothetical protein
VLIAYRLWTRQNTMRDARKAFGFTKEARIFAESGAIYSVTMILVIATYASDSNSFNVFLDMVSREPIRVLPSPTSKFFNSLTDSIPSRLSMTDPGVPCYWRCRECSPS